MEAIWAFPAERSCYVRFGKPFFDRLCALLGLVLLSPLLLAISIAISVDSPGRIFYCQTRVGRQNNDFKLYKFRSMVANAAQLGPQVTRAGDARITRVGKILRMFKLDELPQLMNVLKGDISLVGPRPEVRRYVDMFWQDYQHILVVKPGITDYAALHYVNEEEVLARYADLEQGYIQEVLPRKIEYYRQYIGKISFIEDLRLIFLTVLRIIR
jgi:lipopolysaccharide/colanic/teichoic acid biosynthesis glycosyltransferase